MNDIENKEYVYIVSIEYNNWKKDITKVFQDELKAANFLKKRNDSNDMGRVFIDKQLIH